MNHTERFIARFYQSINKTQPENLTIECISDKLNIEVCYWHRSSTMSELNGEYMLFINEKLSEQQQWQEFGHEMCHYFRDRSNRNLLFSSFVDYSETKADYFAYHFCVPTFMLCEIKGVDVYDVMNLFNVEFDFALRRLEMYQNKILSRSEKLWQKDMHDRVETANGN